MTDLIKRYYNQNKPITFYAIDRELNRKGDRSILNDYIRNYIDRRLTYCSKLSKLVTVEESSSILLLIVLNKLSTSLL